MFGKNCPVIESAQIIGKKWTFPIIDAVFFAQGASFSQLQKTLGGISPKVLSHELKELRKKGVMEKTTLQKNRLKNSKYFLTEEGKDLQQALRTLKQWGVKWKHVPQTCPNANCAACKIEFRKK